MHSPLGLNIAFKCVVGAGQGKKLTPHNTFRDFVLFFFLGPSSLLAYFVVVPLPSHWLIVNKKLHFFSRFVTYVRNMRFQCVLCPVRKCFTHYSSQTIFQHYLDCSVKLSGENDFYVQRFRMDEKGRQPGHDQCPWSVDLNAALHLKKKSCLWLWFRFEYLTGFYLLYSGFCTPLTVHWCVKKIDGSAFGWIKRVCKYLVLTCKYLGNVWKSFQHCVFMRNTCNFKFREKVSMNLLA